MTREEAKRRIDALASDAAQPVDPDKTGDAHRLVGVLPDRALAKLNEGWIRRHGSDVIEFFWSASFNMFNPGNRILTIRTLGGGKFSVETRTSSERFDAGYWQKAENGEPLPGQLALLSDGAEALVNALSDWQVGRGD